MGSAAIRNVVEAPMPNATKWSLPVGSLVELYAQCQYQGAPAKKNGAARGATQQDFPSCNVT